MTPFEVRGQEEGADFVGRALAEALTVRLDRVEAMEPVAEGEASRPAIEITGILFRDGATARTTVRISKPEGAELLGEAEITTDEGDFSSLLHEVTDWARMLAWDARPANEQRLAELKQRLVTLDRIDPASPYDEIMRGYVYRTTGHPDHAGDLYNRVLARTDLAVAMRAWILRQRTFTHRQLGNMEAVRLDPSSAHSLVALSRALETGGRIEEATDHARRALMLEPSAWRQHQRLGIALIRSGNLADARTALERACRFGECQEACANLAVALQRGGWSEEARSAAEHAESLPGSRWGFYNLACYRSLADRRSAAIDDLRRAIDLGFADSLIRTDTDLDPLREDPRFEAILQQA